MTAAKATRAGPPDPRYASSCVCFRRPHSSSSPTTSTAVWASTTLGAHAPAAWPNRNLLSSLSSLFWRPLRLIDCSSCRGLSALLAPDQCAAVALGGPSDRATSGGAGAPCSRLLPFLRFTQHPGFIPDREIPRPRKARSARPRPCDRPVTGAQEIPPTTATFPSNARYQLASDLAENSPRATARERMRQIFSNLEKQVRPESQELKSAPWHRLRCAAAKAPGTMVDCPVWGERPAGPSSSLVNCQPCCRSNSETRNARHRSTSHRPLSSHAGSAVAAPDLSSSVSAPRF